MPQFFLGLGMISGLLKIFHACFDILGHAAQAVAIEITHHIIELPIAFKLHLVQKQLDRKSVV